MDLGKLVLGMNLAFVMLAPGCVVEKRKEVRIRTYTPPAPVTSRVPTIRGYSAKKFRPPSRFDQRRAFLENAYNPHFLESLHPVEDPGDMPSAALRIPGQPRKAYMRGFFRDLNYVLIGGVDLEKVVVIGPLGDWVARDKKSSGHKSWDILEEKWYSTSDLSSTKH